MKYFQRLILPFLLILFTFIIYKFYFDTGSNLGSFTDFDPNNNAVKEIRVQPLADRGINRQNGNVSFFASDKNGKVIMISGSFVLPEGFEQVTTVIIKGHLSGDNFHAHEVLID